MDNDAANTSVLMHRVDPVRNMARFYAMSIAPTLFGEVSLVRNWGRIGKRGQIRLETLGTAREARMAMANLHRIKGRRGYQRPS